MACQAWSKCALNLQCLSSTLKMHSSHLTCAANERAQSSARLEGWAGETKALFYFIIIRSEAETLTKWSGGGDQPPLLQRRALALLGLDFLMSARVKLRQADLPTCQCVIFLSFCPPCCAPLWQIGCTLPPSVSSRRTQPTLTTSARTSLSTRGEPLLNCCLCLSVRQSVQSTNCGATQSTASHISRKGKKYYIT